MHPRRRPYPTNGVTKDSTDSTDSAACRRFGGVPVSKNSARLLPGGYSLCTSQGQFPQAPGQARPRVCQQLLTAPDQGPIHSTNPPARIVRPAIGPGQPRLPFGGGLLGEDGFGGLTWAVMPSTVNPSCLPFSVAVTDHSCLLLSFPPRLPFPLPSLFNRQGAEKAAATAGFYSRSTKARSYLPSLPRLPAAPAPRNESCLPSQQGVLVLTKSQRQLISSTVHISALFCPCFFFFLSTRLIRLLLIAALLCPLLRLRLRSLATIAVAPAA